jgi:hypothetical protein
MKKVLLVPLIAYILASFSFPAQTYAGGLTVPSQIKLDRLECGEYPKAYAYISWKEVEFATSYRFYTRSSDQPFGTPDEIATNSYKLGFNPEFEVKIAVSAVNTFSSDAETNEVLESEKSKEMTLSAEEIVTECKKHSLSGETEVVQIAQAATSSAQATPSKLRTSSNPTPSPVEKPLSTLRAEDIEISEYASSPSAVATRPTTEEMFGSLVQWIKARIPFLQK